MGYPSKLKNFNVFADGDSWQGLVAEVTPPPLKKKVEGFRHGGMLAELDAEMGLEKLELEMKLGGLVLGALRQFGAIGVDGVMLRFVGAYQEEGRGTVQAAEMVARGMHTEFDMGGAKVGEGTEHTVKSTLSYLKWTIAGRVELEIDVMRCVWIQDGVDRMAAIRAAIGL